MGCSPRQGEQSLHHPGPREWGNTQTQKESHVERDILWGTELFGIRYDRPKATQKGAMPGNKHPDLSHLPYLLIPEPTGKAEGCAIHSGQLQWQGAGQAMLKGQAEDIPYTSETFSCVLAAVPQSEDGFMCFEWKKQKQRPQSDPLAPKFWDFGRFNSVLLVYPTIMTFFSRISLHPLNHCEWMTM